jgi:protein kinase A
MGGAASKKDKYVMKKVLVSPAASFSDFDILVDTAPQRSVSGEFKDDIGAVPADLPPIVGRQKSGMMNRSPSVGNIAKTPSMNNMIGRRASSSSKLDAAVPGRPVSRQKSLRGRSNSSVGSSFGGGGGMQFSPKVPWLVKKMPPRAASSMDTFDFKNEQVLGVGLMGTVRLARCVNCKDPAYVAVKSIRKDYIAKHNDQRHINNEKEILTLMTSPFCIQLMGTFQDAEHIYFTMEYAAGGELFRRINRKNGFSPNAAKFYLCEVFLAISHVQNLGYVYRDLKPENVMLDEFGHCKLVDFGFCTRPNQAGMCLTNVGTPAYLSPEQLNGKFTNGYTSIVDWWSLGVLLYELLTGKTPFCKSNSESHYEIYLRVLKGKISFPRGFASSAKELITSLLHADLETRLSDPVQIKNHPFFADVDWRAVEGLQIVPPFIPKLVEPGDMCHFDDFGPFDDRPTRPKKGKKGGGTIVGTDFIEGF